MSRIGCFLTDPIELESVGYYSDSETDPDVCALQCVPGGLQYVVMWVRSMDST